MTSETRIRHINLEIAELEKVRENRILQGQNTTKIDKELVVLRKESATAEKNYPTQVIIIKREALPRVNKKWGYLEKVFKGLKFGHAVQMVLIEERDRAGINAAWHRFCNARGVRGKTMVRQQPNGLTMYLWFE